MARVKFLCKLIPIAIMDVILPILILTLPPHQKALGDPKHCQGYNACYVTGYRDGYNDAQNGRSPAYACVGHIENWCYGYNDGFRVGNGGSNIYYGQRSDESTNINVRGDNNKISVNQLSDNQVGDNSHRSTGGILPNCVILCLNSNVRFK
jgi:hypothetical protein